MCQVLCKWLIQVDDTAVILPYIGINYSIDYNGNSVQLETSYGLTVRFNGIWIVTIQLPENYRNATRGMCGNNNDIGDDDFRINNGTYVGNHSDPGSLIGNSYVVQDNSTSIPR